MVALATIAIGASATEALAQSSEPPAVTPVPVRVAVGGAVGLPTGLPRTGTGGAPLAAALGLVAIGAGVLLRRARS